MLRKHFDIGIDRLNFNSKSASITIYSNQGNSYINAALKICLYDNIIEDFSNGLKYVQDIYDIFKNFKDKLKLTIDISYNISKNLNVDRNTLEEIFVSQNYQRINIDNEKYRKFNIVEKHNITSIITLSKVFANSLDINLQFDIDNIVIDLNSKDEILDNVQREVFDSIFYYIVEYVRTHYFIIKNIDKEYFKANNDMYLEIKRFFKI